VTAPAASLELPAVVLFEEALRHNVATMADYAASAGVSLAPHIKTHMSPELTRRQLDAGAWGVTVATVGQARSAVDFGAATVLIANQVLDPAGLRWIAAARNAGTNVVFLVDSVAGVRAADAALAGAGDDAAPVLLEWGVAGARAGVRDAATGIEVARAVAGSARLRLAGVETYEALVSDTADGVTDVDGHLRGFRRLAGDLDRLGLFRTDEILLSGGGSSFFDRVVTLLADVALSRPTRVVIRPGAYVTHDHLTYPALSPFGTRLRREPLIPAAELWCHVLSRPEPGRALLGFGKRDAPYDLVLPEVLRISGPDATPRRHGALAVQALYDHHAYLSPGPADDLAVGDVVALGLSHPCGIFERWPELPILDAEGGIVATAHSRVIQSR
jgi:D-serine deaminase-like pyridoxal phosphate-dependent protein